MLIQTIFLTTIFAVLAIALIDPLLSWLNKPIYLEHRNLFEWILLGTLLYAAGMIPHYALYAQGIDRPIIQSHIASFVIFIPTTWLFSSQSPYLAVPLGMCTAFALILVWKSWAYFTLTPTNYRPFQS